ncbi:MAG TPA: YdcF family protein [Terracidiphilus sp.]|jgi:uncharacterized SAM-binding protein YcdF (DUF218 family)
MILSAAALFAIIFGWAIMARIFAPPGNTSLSRFDAIIVLGTPADSEGNPTPAQLARVSEAVREYERGIAPHIIMSGGPAHNRFVEAQVMAQTAEAQGVPASTIFVEPEAQDTIQNACFSARIMKAHGWRSAEVISTATHLRRAGIIFSHLPIEWRSHAAPAIEPGASDSATLEVVKTVRYLIYANWAERCTP